jgi:hypothetical protein
MKNAKRQPTITPWEALQREMREVRDHYANSADRWDLGRIIAPARERGITVTWDSTSPNVRHGSRW